MKIQIKEVTVREITEGYTDSAEGGVFGYGGLLNIRPAFQREFVYKDKQRDAVIETVRNGFPLNTMYWSKNKDGTYEVLDGQQRTISLCQYVANDFSITIDGMARKFMNLTNDMKEQILSYKLMIYVCEGDNEEKLAWFKVINIAGEKLTDQELRNAVYTGPWLTDAKRYFSKTKCPAYAIGQRYMSGSPIRQDYLAKTLEWISGDAIDTYMSDHQYDENANALWDYYQRIIQWIERIFPKYRKELMQGLPWGELYNKYKDVYYDKDQLEAEIQRLIDDEEVGCAKGIYPYVLTHDEKCLHLRTFDKKTARSVYEQQHGICPKCGKTFPLEEMEADHIVPWSKGGKTVRENCQMLCRHDNRVKSGK